MKPTLYDLIQEVSTCSFEAAVIADRLQSVSSDQSIEQLKATIAKLKSVIDVLKLEVESSSRKEAVFTDEQAKLFSESFRSSFKDLNFGILSSVYDKLWLQNIPDNLRVLACTELYNYFVENKKEPPKLWTDVIYFNGSL